MLLQILPAGTTTPHASPLIALNTPIELQKPFSLKPPTHNTSSSSLSQQAEAAVTDVDAAEISSATQTSSRAVGAELSPEQIADRSSEQTEEQEITFRDTMPADHGGTADEHAVHRKLLQMNRILATAAQHPNTSTNGLSSGPNRLQSEKLNGMIGSSNRAFGKPGK